MNDVSAEELQTLRKIRYEELQKIKEQLQEQDLKWQEVRTPLHLSLCILLEGAGCHLPSVSLVKNFGMCAAIHGAVV